MSAAYMAVCAERDRYAEICGVTALALDGVKDERDRYKAEVSNVMRLMGVVVDERDRYRDALERIANLQAKPTAGLSNACALARAALDGEG